MWMFYWQVAMQHINQVYIATDKRQGIQ